MSAGWVVVRFDQSVAAEHPGFAKRERFRIRWNNVFRMKALLTQQLERFRGVRHGATPTETVLSRKVLLAWNWAIDAGATALSRSQHAPPPPRDGPAHSPAKEGTDEPRRFHSEHRAFETVDDVFGRVPNEHAA